VHLAKPQRYAIAWVLCPVIVLWLVNGFYMAALARVSVPLFWLADVVQWIVLPITLLVILSKRASLLPRNYGLDISALRWQSPVMGTLGVFVTTGLALSITRNLSWHLLGQPTGFFSLPNVFPQGLLGTIVWLYSALTAGFVESIFFIGLPWLLYHNARREPSRVGFCLGKFSCLRCSTLGARAARCHWRVLLKCRCLFLVLPAWHIVARCCWPCSG